MVPKTGESKREVHLMYAIVETGGKQYRVQAGDEFNVEKLPGDVGSEVVLDRVLLIGGDETKVGTPYLEGAKVKAQIVEQDKARKILVPEEQRRTFAKGMAIANRIPVYGSLPLKANDFSSVYPRG